MSHFRRVRLLVVMVVCLSALLILAGCQGFAQPHPLGLAASILRGGSAPAAAEAAAAAAPEGSTPTTATPAAPAAQAGAEEDRGGAVPVALTIPAIHLGAEVTPMGWELAMNGDVVTTRWVLPLDTLGWAVNSAAAGAPGNVIIAGHQALGAELFRPLALGEVTIGQEIRLLGVDGVTYVYRVREVSPPIPAIGATADETAQAAAYLAASDDARLTLLSGWPADTTTHRLFVVAEYEGKTP